MTWHQREARSTILHDRTGCQDRRHAAACRRDWDFQLDSSGSAETPFPSMNVIEGWLSTARRVSTPNCDARPDPEDISLIVIHCISLPPGEFGGPWIDALFSNRLDAGAHPYFQGVHHLRVSAHLLIRRNAEIVQYVPFHRRAYHAGVSRYGGRTACNDFSIGIELEGTETVPYTEDQYRQLGKVVDTLLRSYPSLSPERIAGHSDIAPERKTDPGPSFDWQRFRDSMRTGGASPEKYREAEPVSAEARERKPG